MINGFHFTALARWSKVAAFSTLLGLTVVAHAFTPSQQPPETSGVPGNVVLALSVEFPTGLQQSYSGAYSYTVKYDGYFDNRKCYTYSSTNEVFQPVSKLSVTDGTCPVSTQWSGNLLNWLTMTNVDQFRYVMTGGARDNFSAMNSTYAGDTTARTVLIRSSSDRNSYTTTKTLTGLPGMPLAGTQLARSGGFGSKFVVASSNPGGSITIDRTNIDASCATSPFTSASCFHVRVEVCKTVPISQAVPDVGLEANCKGSYSGVPKPEGLIQEYANPLRFAAFGYLNETGQARNGGVLRAAMKSVGALSATSTGYVANTAAEWNATTGIQYTNPDSADATATSVSNSGIINYLNKFGFEQGYKGNDPVGELYYAAQLYLRGIAPPANYTSGTLTAASKDGFPVITGSALQAGGTRDPMINTCQKNFILGIGDIYTHCDGNLPGSTKGVNSTCGTGLPTDTLNVQTLWDTTRALEGLSDTGWVGGATSGTPYMAGLAHWANTNDIRTDTNMPGKQTVSTYWVDVLENTNGAANVAAASLLKSQFWLAAKYGGFDTSLVTGNDPNGVRASWDANNDNIPDNWFAGSDPISMRAGLSAAFADIAVKAGASSASSAAVTSNRQTSNSQILYAGYNPKNWVGNVRACAPTQSAAQCDSSPAWEASRWFKTTTPTYVTTPLTPSTRKIFTSSGGGTTLTTMPFLWGSLNTSQQASLNGADSQGSARVSYLRGDRTNEQVLFRKREDTLLGDIVNSGVTYLSGAGPTQPSIKSSLYTSFRQGNSARPAVVYVGANDGMLHAFSGTDGKELFAYIPGAVFGNLNGLTSLNFQHKFFVDSTPMVSDVQQNSTTWRTLLVGGLGAGGKGYYGLNITDQANFATETQANLSSMPIWEVTASQDADLGYTFNEPSLDPFSGGYRQIARVADDTGTDGKWRVIVGNGYGSTDGKAVLLMLDANTGVDTTSGAVPTKLTADTGPNNGLSAPTPVDTDRDGLIDTVYAGDLSGNMHKFQFSKLNTAATDYIVAKPGTTGGGAWRYIGVVYATGEPITTAPSVTPACDGNGWIVAFGTGKLNESGDYTDSSARGFYAVTDKMPSSSTLPSSTLTVASTSLATISHTTTTVSSRAVRDWSDPSLTGKSGWKMAFTGGERVLSNSTLPPDTGVVVFGTTKPSGDVCTPGNTGFIMSVNLCSGKSDTLSVAGMLVGGVGINSTGVVKVSNTYTNSGNKQTIVCNQDDCKGTGAPTVPTASSPKGRYSWRELFSK